MKTISIILGKIVLKMCKLINRGSAFPGKFTYKINKKILKQLEKPKLIICVTGSSGKGSTSDIIYNALKNNNLKVGYNNKGSNELNAVITTMIENCSLTGKNKVDAYVFETDERYAKYIYKDLKPNYVIVTNITRDQPPRQYNYDFVLNEINKALDDNIHVIINADDPFMQKLKLGKNVTYYSIDKQLYSYEKSIIEPLNIERCPICNHRLKYHYYNFEYLGNYSCPNCNFKRKKAKQIITDINYDKNIITINKNLTIKVNNNLLFNLYNIIASITVLKEVNIPDKVIKKTIEQLKNNPKIYDNYTYKKKNVYVLNNKNENATTFNSSLLFVNRDNKPKTIIIGWYQISRRYDFDDLSWLYDISFELLNKPCIKKIIVAGPQKYDIAVRLKYAGINQNKIKAYNNLSEAKESLYKAPGDLYAILNFDYIKPFNDIMKGSK